MASKHPGKFCRKKIADMTPFELEQHRIYNSSVYSYRKSLAPPCKKVVSKYPGKNCTKKAADMTPEEIEQVRIYRNASHAANVGKRRALARPERLRLLAIKVKANQLSAAKKKYLSCPDSYMVSLILKKGDVSKEDITPKMIKARRSELRARRKARYSTGHCSKKVADMTPEELADKKLYIKTRKAEAHRAKRLKEFGPKIRKYPGKRSGKPIADRTPYEHEQNKLYTRSYVADYRKNQSEARKEELRVVAKLYQRRPEVKVKRAVVSRNYMLNNKDKHRIRVKKQIDILGNCYVKGVIHSSTGLPYSAITQEMVSMKRSTILIKRLVKTMN